MWLPIRHPAVVRARPSGADDPDEQNQCATADADWAAEDASGRMDAARPSAGHPGGMTSAPAEAPVVTSHV